MSNVQARATKMISRHGFLGVPLATFEEAGREQLIALLREGLNPGSKVLEFGCGCLRIAYWLIRFLNPGGYHGIEPARERVGYGLEYLFSPDEIRSKQPRFDFNAQFDSSIFGERYDFFLARSIWTHASKQQIEAMLDSFVHDAVSRASVFLTSYLPTESNDPGYQAFLAARFPPLSPESDYRGDRWVGTSHESDTPGVIQHSLAWIAAQCERRGLCVTELPGIDCDSQVWLRIDPA